MQDGHKHCTRQNAVRRKGVFADTVHVTGCGRFLDAFGCPMSVNVREHNRFRLGFGILFRLFVRLFFRVFFGIFFRVFCGVLAGLLRLFGLVGLAVRSAGRGRTAAAAAAVKFVHIIFGVVHHDFIAVFDAVSTHHHIRHFSVDLIQPTGILAVGEFGKRRAVRRGDRRNIAAFVDIFIAVFIENLGKDIECRCAVRQIRYRHPVDPRVFIRL